MNSRGSVSPVSLRSEEKAEREEAGANGRSLGVLKPQRLEANHED